MKNIITWVAILTLFAMSGLALYSSQNNQKALNPVNDLVGGLRAEVQTLISKSTATINLGVPIGYVIEFENGKKFYTSGDTGLMADMKLIIGDYYEPDVAILCVGDISAMGFETAAYATYLINPQYAIAEHYHSFPKLTSDLDGLGKALTKYGMEDKYLKFIEGETKDVLGIKVTWLGHSAWLFESPDGTRILTDPNPENNPNWPEQYKDFLTLKPIDIILITHGHSDHVKAVDLRKLVSALDDPIVMAQGELAGWLKGALPYNNMVGVGPGGHITKEKIKKAGISVEKVDKLADITIAVVSAGHSSSALPEVE
ncbi:MBL fold metallo-hydrolase [Patescibacteria group bacterium]